MTIEQVVSELGRILDQHLAITQIGMAVMVGFPDPGDEPAAKAAASPPGRLPPPPLPRRNLPPED